VDPFEPNSVHGEEDLGMQSSKRVIVQSNWKMYKSHAEAIDWIHTLGKGSSRFPHWLELIVCVPFVHVRAVAQAVRDYPLISVGAQNVHTDEYGAFTGEISAPMLADAGAKYCVVGHSERREGFGETDEMVNKKIRVLLQCGISPIACIGESLPQREKGLTFNQVERQSILCFSGLSHEEMKRIVVLYEPVWSIGTGRNATPEQAQEGHSFVRQMIARLFSSETARDTRIMYGGSVKTHNVADLIQGPDIDGVGAGSGSLVAEDFLELAHTCASSSHYKNRSSFNALP